MIRYNQQNVCSGKVDILIGFSARGVIKVKTKKILCALLIMIGFCLSTSTFTKASEPPVRIERDDGGNYSDNGAYYRFYYQLIRESYDPITETVVYKLGQYFSISYASIPVYSDKVYLTNQNGTNMYIGEFSKHNGSSVSPGTYTRDVWYHLTLTEGKNTIIIKGEYSGNDSGDAKFEINIDKFGHNPVVHGANGTWIAGEVSSGKRTWQSLYTDGATGSAEGNKAATSTGFTYTDEDEQKTPVNAYVNVPISNNASISKIEKQNSNGTWSTIATANWSEMDNAGVYRITSTTKDQAGNTASGTRIVTVQQKKYSVKYNKNATNATGSMANSTHIYDTAKNLTSNSYERTGYQFGSWNTKSDGTGTSYSNTQSVKNLTNTNGAIVNLYAQWIPNTYTIKYNANGGTGYMASSKHSYDQSKELSSNNFKRYGWKFIGWNTKADGTGTSYTDKQSVKNLTSVNNGTINLYATWDQEPAIHTTNKMYYQGEISEADWLETIRMQGITATDREDGEITSKIIVSADNVNLQKVGTYSVFYTVTDSADQTVTKSANVTIRYNNYPSINASDRMYWLGKITQQEWKDILRMLDVNADDKEDGDISDDIKIILDEVDTTTAGVYRVIYEVADAFGKICEKIIQVEIRYNNSPIIIADNLAFHENEYDKNTLLELLMNNASASDPEDGDITQKIEIISNDVNPSKAGVYEVIYMVEDSLNKITTKTIDVTVLENREPILQLFAPSKRFIEGEYTQAEWEDQLRMIGVTAYDQEDKDITDKIEVISDTTNTQKRGTYEVTYKATDRWGKSETKRAKITVEPNEAPIIYANDRYFKTTDNITDKLLLRNVYASDDHDGDVSKQIKITSNNIINGKAGTYDITYEVSDRFGKTTTKSVKIHIEQIGSKPSTPIDPIPSDPTAISVWNGRQMAKINLLKLMEHSEIDDDPSAYKNVVFGVYCAEDISYKGNIVLPKNSLIATSKLDENYNIDVMIDLAGKYFIQELSTDENYLLNNERYFFEFKYK